MKTFLVSQSTTCARCVSLMQPGTTGYAEGCCSATCAAIQDIEIFDASTNALLSRVATRKL